VRLQDVEIRIVEGLGSRVLNRQVHPLRLPIDPGSESVGTTP
jgi:hypothetical protein